MHASNLLKAVLKPRSITSSSSGQSLNSSKDSKARSGPRASTPETASASLSVSKKAPTKMSCLCAPTNHAGSFRCRLHRGNQQSWGGKPLTPAAPAPKPTPSSSPPAAAAAESRSSVSPVGPLPTAVEKSVSNRLLHQAPRQPSNNFLPHPHTHRTSDARQSRLRNVSVATQVEAPIVEAHVPVPAPKEAPGTVRYLKFTGGVGCGSAAVLEAGVVAIRKLQVSGKKDVMLDVFGSESPQEGHSAASLGREFSGGAGLSDSEKPNTSKYEQGPLLSNVKYSW